MTPGGARDLMLGFTDTCLSFCTSLTPGLLNSLDWTPGLLNSLPLRLTPSLLLGGKFRAAPGRGALDADGFCGKFH